MSFAYIICEWLIHLQRPLKLRQELTEICGFGGIRYLAQCLGNRLQLVVAGETAPDEGLPACSIERVAYRLSDVTFECP
jgi:hypothetical protein